MSSPAVVPHFRPAGCWPQFLVTVGFGLGNPWPVTTLGAGACVCAIDPGHAVRLRVAEATANNGAIRGVDICTPPIKRPKKFVKVLVNRTNGPLCKPKTCDRILPSTQGEMALELFRKRHALEATHPADIGCPF